MDTSPQTNPNANDNTPSYSPPDTLKKENPLLELLRIALIAIIIVLPIRLFIAQPFVVAGSSMSPTFETGQYLVVDQATYHTRDPKRSEVVIFRYPKDPSKFFIKRIVGLPNETVTISNGLIRITNKTYPNGFIYGSINGEYVEGETTRLRTGEYFVLGDNRDASSDSRTWGILPRENIIGRTLVRLLPLSQVQLFPGDIPETTETH